MEKQTLSRKELYDLAWSESMLSLSKKYSISDVGLRKICIRMSIPIPQNGHWQKIQFGKKVNQPPLPSNHTGDAEVTLTIRSEDMKHVSADGLSPLKTLQNEIENDLKSKLSVPEKLNNPDKLIIVARESLNSKDRYEHNGLVSCKRGELDIRAAKPNVPRALRFMDIFIKGLRARGHDIIIDNDATCAFVNTQSLKISFREKTKRIPGNDRWQTFEYIPTGILIFKLDKVCYDKEWMDGRLKIEDQLSAIVSKLEMVSAELNERDKRWAKERELEKKKQEVQKAFEIKQQEELANFKETLLKASRWDNYRRTYVPIPADYRL